PPPYEHVHFHAVRISLRAPLVAVLFSLAAGSVEAQGYPAKPIRVVVPFAAGGVVDTTARALVPRMADGLGQPLVVDNRPGAGGPRRITPPESSSSKPPGWTSFTCPTRATRRWSSRSWPMRSTWPLARSAARCSTSAPESCACWP